MSARRNGGRRGNAPLVRAELEYSALIPPWPVLRGAVVPCLFASRGQAINLRPTIVEARTVAATNIGGGVRATLIPNVQPSILRPVDLGIEGARQFGDHPGDDGWRVNANAFLRLLTNRVTGAFDAPRPLHGDRQS